MLKTEGQPIRVVVIDDSPTARELLAAILRDAEGIHVVGVGSNGEEAVRLTKRMRPDVVTMDVRMPDMDGLEATRRIMRETPTPIVIVTGSMMRDDIDLTFEALQAGALTVIGKPGLADPETCKKVVQTVRLMAGVPVIHHWGKKERPPSPTAAQPSPPQVAQQLLLIEIDVLRQVQIVGIAASTGGPAALATVLKPLPPDFPLPILVVQHITPGFVAGFAEWLNGQTALRVAIASHGDIPRPGVVLLATDDYHIQVNHRRVVELSKDPPYKNLRPSANYLFSSLARVYGPQAMGIVLSGMGDDGAEGLEALCRAGGLTVAQDEQSCVVYGMPHEAVVRNAVGGVLSLDQIALLLDRLPKADAGPLPSTATVGRPAPSAPAAGPQTNSVSTDSRLDQLSADCSPPASAPPSYARQPAARDGGHGAGQAGTGKAGRERDVR
jgi:two-component system chemotaxis response regulator CheB